jgi:hypothetical protein
VDPEESIGAAWWTGDRIRLGVLLCLLAGLVAFYVAAPGGILRPASDSGAAECPPEGTPRVINVPAGYLASLRTSIVGVVPLRIGRLYEEGTIEATNAWSDDFPSRPTLSPHALRPAGYEMRWWAPTGDDIVADVFVFATAAQAQRFLSHVVIPRCHNSARQTLAPWPMQAHNLRWINPERFAQTDVFFARGARVYRVADVPVGQQRGNWSRVNLHRAFLTVDGLACLLPEANCSIQQSIPT